MKFHDAIKKHIKVLDSIQRLRTKDAFEDYDSYSLGRGYWRG